jgi:hypothetical protein
MGADACGHGAVRVRGQAKTAVRQRKQESPVARAVEIEVMFTDARAHSCLSFVAMYEFRAQHVHEAISGR